MWFRIVFFIGTKMTKWRYRQTWILVRPLWETLFTSSPNWNSLHDIRIATDIYITYMPVYSSIFCCLRHIYFMWWFHQMVTICTLLRKKFSEENVTVSVALALTSLEADTSKSFTKTLVKGQNASFMRKRSKIFGNEFSDITQYQH